MKPAEKCYVGTVFDYNSPENSLWILALVSTGTLHFCASFLLTVDTPQGTADVTRYHPFCQTTNCLTVRRWLRRRRIRTQTAGQRGLERALS